MQFLGQQNVTNAYVSGMREDLNAFGNELNYYVVSCEWKTWTHFPQDAQTLIFNVPR